MLPSGWKDVTLDYDRADEGFTDEDVDRFTELVDMKGSYEFILVLIPTIESALVSVRVQNDEKKDTNPFAVHDFLDISADNTVLQATTDGTGNIAVVLRIGGAQWFRLYCSANQTADRVFKVQGYNRAPSIG